jgi:protein-S-isoprenylcysteine O-methyltransferase Ste14
MYAVKLVIVIGNFVVSGSLWFVVAFVYLLAETTRTIIKEERYLRLSIPGYKDYTSRTSRIVPFIF